MTSSWSIAAAREAYRVPHWSGGYFDVNERGHVVARPNRDPACPGVDLHALAAELGESGLSLPVLVRFPDILHDRIDTLCGAFGDAISSEGYRGRHLPVYPIKVNQHSSVVGAILRHGAGRVGLEAGSKPELMVVLALSPPEGVIICNGYKDREYIRLALIGRQLGMRVHIVIEKPGELDLVLEEAAAMGIEPLLGIRARLASIGSGKWQNTGGEKSKFGLSAAQALVVLDRLKDAGRREWLTLLHFHLGSQIANVRDIQNGLREVGRYYVELHRLGFPVQIVDVGGGLGVDYEGARSRSFCSMNYTVQEYANNVVHALWEVAQAEGLPHPDIVTESGRAMTAHHAVLITNVTDVDPIPAPVRIAAPPAGAPQILKDLHACLEGVDSRSAIEAYHDAQYWLAEAQELFTHGVLSLADRAYAERVHQSICLRVLPLMQGASRSQREVFDELRDRLYDKYFCNFSVFQSMPDVWAIDQIFPMMPLHRLDEEPDRRGVIQDLTCDSDGHVELYVHGDGIEHSLLLHAPRAGERYLIGIFLVGAYQEILGDLHNLFGDTSTVNVVVKPDGTHTLAAATAGDTVASVIESVAIRHEDLVAAYRAKARACERLTPAARAALLRELEAGLLGTTYLED